YATMRAAFPSHPRMDDSTVSKLLDAWSRREPGARDQVVAAMYEELRRLAHAQMRKEQPGHALQTTALVNEMYLRLAGVERMQWRDRSHFLAMAATLMRRVLVEYARAAVAEKRGGGISVT